MSCPTALCLMWYLSTTLFLGVNSRERHRNPHDVCALKGTFATLPKCPAGFHSCGGTALPAALGYCWGSKEPSEWLHLFCFWPWVTCQVPCLWKWKWRNCFLLNTFSALDWKQHSSGALCPRLNLFWPNTGVEPSTGISGVCWTWVLQLCSRNVISPGLLVSGSVRSTDSKKRLIKFLILHKSCFWECILVYWIWHQYSCTYVT